MKEPEIPLEGITDISIYEDKTGLVPVYHVHGKRQGLGTCRLHKTPECPHLRHWKPGHVCTGRMGKYIMLDYEKPDGSWDFLKCRTCWK